MNLTNGASVIAVRASPRDDLVIVARATTYLHSHSSEPVFKPSSGIIVEVAK